jgi:integrase
MALLRDKGRKSHRTSGERALSKEQSEQLINAASTYQDRLMFLTAITLGLRRDDLVSLEISGVDLEKGTLQYKERKKGMRFRTVPMSARLISEMRLYLNNHCDVGQQFLFPSAKKAASPHLASKTAYNRFNEVADKIGLHTPIPIHALRATCIKLKIAEGWTIQQVAALLGDTVAVVQEHYATPSEAELIEQMKKGGGI